jgi:hypothetical protein
MDTDDRRAERAIDRFYELEEADPRDSAYGIMLVDNVLYRVTIDAISRSGKTVFYTCNDQPGSATRDRTGEWQTDAEPRYPIRFVNPAPRAADGSVGA